MKPPWQCSRTGYRLVRPKIGGRHPTSDSAGIPLHAWRYTVSPKLEPVFGGCSHAIGSGHGSSLLGSRPPLQRASLEQIEASRGRYTPVPGHTKGRTLYGYVDVVLVRAVRAKAAHASPVVCRLQTRPSLSKRAPLESHPPAAVLCVSVSSTGRMPHAAGQSVPTRWHRR